MLKFDLVSALNILIGSIAGGIASWVISHYYWKKNSPSERILKELKKALPEYFQPIRYPQFYSNDAIVMLPEQQPPQDKDTPHIIRAIFTKKNIYEMDYIEVLLEIRDHGINLDNPGGLSARDHAQRDLAPKFCGIGYASVSFTADFISDSHKNYLTITLRDNAGKQNTQSIPFTISKR